MDSASFAHELGHEAALQHNAPYGSAAYGVAYDQGFGLTGEVGMFRPWYLTRMNYDYAFFGGPGLENPAFTALTFSDGRSAPMPYAFGAIPEVCPFPGRTPSDLGFLDERTEVGPGGCASVDWNGDGDATDTAARVRFNDDRWQNRRRLVDARGLPEAPSAPARYRVSTQAAAIVGDVLAVAYLRCEGLECAPVIRADGDGTCNLYPAAAPLGDVFGPGEAYGACMAHGSDILVPTAGGFVRSVSLVSHTAADGEREFVVLTAEADGSATWATWRTSASSTSATEVTNDAVGSPQPLLPPGTLGGVFDAASIAAVPIPGGPDILVAYRNGLSGDLSQLLLDPSAGTVSTPAFAFTGFFDVLASDWGPALAAIDGELVLLRVGDAGQVGLYRSVDMELGQWEPLLPLSGEVIAESIGAASLVAFRFRDETLPRVRILFRGPFNAPVTGDYFARDSAAIGGATEWWESWDRTIGSNQGERGQAAPFAILDERATVELPTRGLRLYLQTDGPGFSFVAMLPFPTGDEPTPYGDYDEWEGFHWGICHEREAMALNFPPPRHFRDRSFSRAPLGPTAEGDWCGPYPVYAEPAP